jgi:hypothetical protein
MRNNLLVRKKSTITNFRASKFYLIFLTETLPTTGIPKKTNI